MVTSPIRLVRARLGMVATKALRVANGKRFTRQAATKALPFASLEMHAAVALAEGSEVTRFLKGS